MTVHLSIDDAGRWLASVRPEQEGVVDWECKRFDSRQQALLWIMDRLDSNL